MGFVGHGGDSSTFLSSEAHVGRTAERGRRWRPRAAGRRARPPAEQARTEAWRTEGTGAPETEVGASQSPGR